MRLGVIVICKPKVGGMAMQSSCLNDSTTDGTS